MEQIFLVFKGPNQPPDPLKEILHKYWDIQIGGGGWGTGTRVLVYNRQYIILELPCHNAYSYYSNTTHIWHALFGQYVN